MKRILFLPLVVCLCLQLFATDYHVGPGQSLTAIAEVPWESLMPGDRVFIYHKATPYYEKWVLNRQGTPNQPIQIVGVSGPQGEQPVISGENATTRQQLNYWGEDRGVIKIGGSSVPNDGLPAYLEIANLEIRAAQPDYQFSDDSGNTQTYRNNAAAIYIEKGANITIRNCTLTDAGNGLFVGAFDGMTQNILIQGNYIYGNGIVNRILEHNAYTECIGITYQYNRFGPLRNGALGNNLKDRSAGTVVRYNWIEGGNRQLDLVDAENNPNLVNDPSYPTTYVYGNILIEPDGAGNSQIVHYGGDSGTTANYRKGTLYFYHNTVVSTRADNTTLLRLSTNDETVEVVNNIIYNSAAGNRLAMSNDAGTLNLSGNWLRTNWRISHSNPNANVNDLGNNVVGDAPGFVDAVNQEFDLTMDAAARDIGVDPPSSWGSNHPVILEYVKHRATEARYDDAVPDAGAYERAAPLSVHPEVPDSAERLEGESVHFANPVRDVLTVRWENHTITKMELIDQNGRRAAQSRKGHLSVEQLANGWYWLRVTSSVGKTSVHPVVIARR